MSRLTVITLALVASSSALADTTRYSTRGEFVNASYYTGSSDGCASTYVTIGANETRESGSGPSTVTTYVYVGDYNYCTGTFTYYTGSLDNVTMSASGATGSVSGSGTLYDYYSGAPLAVTISATVGSEDGSYHGMSNTHQSQPGVTYHMRSNGSYSYGTATITVNGTTYTQAGGGSFGRTTSGQLTITEN